MANFNISYKFVAIDKFSKVSKKIGRTVDGLGKKINRFSAMSMKSIMSLKGAFVGLLAGIGVTQVAGVFRTLGAGFEDQVADLQSLTGAAGKDLDFLKEKAFALGKEFSVSGSEVVEAFKLVGGAKAELLKNIPALAETTKEVLKLKNAAGIDLSSAAIFTAQTLNQFGEGADQAARFVNVFAAGAKEGASEILDTGEAMMVAGPLAYKLGLSFEQVNAMLQGIAQGGLKGRIAGTGLQGVLARLSALGVDFSKTDLDTIFIKIGDAIDKETNAGKKAQLIQKLFGLEHQKTGLTLVSQARTLNKLTKALTGTNTAQEQASIRLKTFNAKMRSLGTIIEEKVYKTFVRLAPKLEELTLRFGAWLETITPEDIDKVANAFVRVADAVTLIVDNLDRVKKAQDIFEKFTGLGMLSKGSRELLGMGAEKLLGKSKSEVEITLKGNTGAIQSVKTKAAKSTGLNVGQSMVPAT